MKDLGAFLSANKTRLLPLAILLFLALATFFTLSLAKRSQDLRSKAALNDTGQLTFANLTPTTVNPGQTFSVAVNMASGATGVNIVGADVLVCFDRNKLTLQSVARNTTTTVYRTYAPVDANGNFDTTRVLSTANNTNTPCNGGAGNGVVEFGVISFDWAANGGAGALTTPTNALSPVATLTFLVKTGAASGATPLAFVNNGIAATTDSNIVVNPAGGGDPEDILQAAPYTGSSATVTVGGTASPVPTATPSPSPSTSPSTNPSPSTSPACAVDINKDGVVNIFDYAILKTYYFQACSGSPGVPPNYNSCNADVNKDGTVNIFDYGQLKAQYFNTCQ